MQGRVLLTKAMFLLSCDTADLVRCASRGEKGGGPSLSWRTRATSANRQWTSLQNQWGGLFWGARLKTLKTLKMLVIHDCCLEILAGWCCITSTCSCPSFLLRSVVSSPELIFLWKSSSASSSSFWACSHKERCYSPNTEKQQTKQDKRRRKHIQHLTERVRTYISFGLGLAVVGFSAGHLWGGAGVHFVLQLCDLLRQLLQGLHDVGPLLRFHPSVLLQAVY